MERGRGERGALVKPHADTPVLVQTEENIAVSARHDVQQGGGVSLDGERANGLPDLHVHHHDLSRVDDEEVVFVCRGEDDLPAVDLCDTLLPSVSEWVGG